MTYSAAPPPVPPTSCRVLLLLALPALLAGCGNGAPAAETGPREQGVDALLPPDIQSHDGAARASIGKPCDPALGDQHCSGSAECLDLRGGGTKTPCDLSAGKGCGVCALPGCTMEDNATSVVEDSCPAGSACTLLPVLGGDKTFCLDRCAPRLDQNDCAKKHAGLTCHPASIVLTGYTEVCIYPACTADADCGNRDPLKPDSICLAQSGMCLSRGDSQAKVGAPCSTSSDCGPYQSCLLEQKDQSGTTVFEGGYCTIIGCKYDEAFADPSQPYWRCPAESKCFFMGSGQFVSFCLATSCEPSKPPEADGCRDEASPGQYDCIELGAEKVCWLDIKSGQ